MGPIRQSEPEISYCYFGQWTLCCDDMATKIANVGGGEGIGGKATTDVRYGDHNWHVDGKACHLSYCVKVPPNSEWPCEIT